MKLSSVRARLTLWNVGVLALALFVLAAVASFLLRAELINSVDRELSDSARHDAWRWARFQDLRLSGKLPPPRRSEATPRDAAARVRGEDPEDVRRPRFLDSSGHSLFGKGSPGAIDRSAIAPALRGKTIEETLLRTGDEIRVHTGPLLYHGRIVGVLQLAHPLTELHRLLHSFSRTMLLLIPLALLGAALGGLFLASRALRPVREITTTAGQIGAEDLSRRIPVEGADEFALLASTFNGMIERLEGAFSQLQSAVEQQRRFAADASHELRTPLTTIKANTSLALTGRRSPEQYREALVEADGAANTMERIVRDLLLLARSDAGQLELELRPTDLAEVIDRAVSLGISGETASVETRLPDPSPDVLADSHHLIRLFANLLENAARHTPVEGEIKVIGINQGDWVSVHVEDSGDGIPADHLTHVFERFYRVDGARSRESGGTGLGLAICKSIVEAHGGSIEVESGRDWGTRVTVNLRRVPFTSHAGQVGRQDVLLAEPVDQRTGLRSPSD